MADASIKLAVDGEKEFRKQIDEAAESARVLNSEMKLLTSEFDKNDQSQEKLSKQADILSRQLENQEKKISALNGMVEAYTKEYGEADSRTQKFVRQLNDAQAAANRYARQLAEVQDAMDVGPYEALSREVKDQEDAVEALKNAYKDAALSYGQNSKEAGDLADQITSLTKDLQENREKMSRLDDAADDLTPSLKDAGDAAENAGVSFGDLLGADLVSGALQSLAGSLKDVADETKEYRRIMASLENSSEQAGYTAEETAESYRTLYGVLGDNQTAATTVSNLQAIGFEQRDLEKIINGTIGAWARYGDSIPIDGLAESVNETINVGQVTGTFADVLNWAKVSEDEFNAVLASTNDTTERAQKVMELFTEQGLVAAGEAWQENNKGLVEANQATADQEAALARLGEVAEPLLTEITELTTGLLNFLMDNGPIVITIVTGIGAALAAMNAKKALSGVESVLAGIKSAVTGNPFAVAATGVAAFVAALQIGEKQFKAAHSEIMALADENDRLVSSMADSRSAFDAAIGGLEDAGTESQATAALARDLVDELSRLDGQTQKTAGEQAEMAQIVDQLNALYPDLNLSVNEFSGELSMTVDDLDDYVDAMERAAYAAAMQDAMEEAVAALVDEQIALEKSRVQYGKTEDSMEAMEKTRTRATEAIQAQVDAENAYEQAVATGAENIDELREKMIAAQNVQIEYNGEMLSAKDALSAVNEGMAALSDEQAGFSDEIARQEEAVSSAEEDLSVYRNAMDNLTGSTDEATGAAAGLNDELKKTSEGSGDFLSAFEGIDNSLQEKSVSIANSLLEMRDSVQNSVQSQIDIFAEYAEQTEISADEVLQNMRDNAQAIQEWGDNLAAITEETKTTADGLQVTLDEGIIEYLANLGPEGAAMIQAFRDMSAEEWQEVNETVGGIMDVTGSNWYQKMEYNYAVMEAGGVEGWNQLNSTLGLKADESGKYQINNYIGALGSAAAMSAAREEAGGVANSALSALDARAGNYTVSGQEAGGNYATGVRSKNSSARSAGQGLASSGADGASDYSSYYNSGYYSGEGYAAGIRGSQELVRKAAKSIASTAVNSMNSWLGIASPSKVFEKSGYWSGEGYAIGLEKEKERIKKATNEMLSGAVSYAELPAVSAGVTGNAEIRTAAGGIGAVNIVVNAAPGQSEQAIADAVMRRMQSEVSKKGAVW